MTFVLITTQKTVENVMHLHVSLSFIFDALCKIVSCNKTI